MIEKIIGNYLEIKQNGKNYKCLCPFHDDKHPSLHIDINKDIYKCFSCGAGGGILKFVMEYENIDINNAKNKINSILGINLYKYNDNNIDFKQKEILDNYISLANAFLNNKKNNESKNIGLEYLQNRKINIGTINKFEIGYVDEDMLKILNINYPNINNDLYKQYGLLSENNEIKHKNRIIIPIFKNNIINGFTARSLVGEEYKYLNSQDLDKSELLFGLNKIDKNCEILYFTEGIFDCLTLNQIGCNSVCSLGVNVTDNQIELLNSLPKLKQVIISFDNDNAGYQNSLELFRRLRKSYKYLSIGFIDYYGIENKDINEIYCNNEDSLKHMVSNSIDLNLFKANHYIKTLDPNISNNWLLINDDISIGQSMFRCTICNRLKENGFDVVSEFYLDNISRFEIEIDKSKERKL